jgi:hypothetical protein
MAFLDNSGDIILDAVLTDLGRKRMAQGKFKITKFAFGDDEIDYSLYNKTHPSGSAYYDLEILQTPVFEAFTSTNANLNYGLLSFTRDDLLYLPSLKTNELVGDSPLFKTGSIYYLAANSETAGYLEGSNAHGDKKYFAQSGTSTSRKIVIESGLDTTELKGDSSNRTSYIVSANLLDKTYSVSFDNRFITSIIAPDAGSVFSNESDGTDSVSFAMTTVAATSTSNTIDNYSLAPAVGVANKVYYNASADTTDTTVSDIAGPRGSATALGFTCDSGLAAISSGTRDSKYSLYGSTDTALFADGYLYDYIDTTVYVQGDTSSMQIQLPVRIIRYVSGA